MLEKISIFTLIGCYTGKHVNTIPPKLVEFYVSTTSFKVKQKTGLCLRTKGEGSASVKKVHLEYNSMA